MSSNNVSSNSNDVDVATDAAGNVLWVGRFWLYLDFDGTEFLTASGTDVFVAKLDGGTGDTLWVRQVGSDSTSEAHPRVESDETGRVWVLATDVSYWLHIRFPLTTFNSEGEVLVNRLLPPDFWAPNLPDAQTWHMTLDNSGHLLFSGLTMGSVDFGGGERVSSSHAAFVAWYDSTGTYVADRTYPAMTENGAPLGAVWGKSVATDSVGNVLLGGYFQGTVDFGNGPVQACSSPFLLRFKPTL